MAEPLSLGFPQASNNNFLHTVSITRSSSPQTINGVIYVKLTPGTVAAKDIHITLSVNDALRASYNLVNNDTIAQMPASVYNIATGITITAGKDSVGVPINLLSTSTLLPDKTYAIGITISSADAGCVIPDNLRNMLVSFRVTDMYAGVYNSTGYFYHRLAPHSFNLVKTVLASGPNSVAVDLADLGGNSYRSRLNIDPITNNLIITAAPGAAGAPYTQFSNGLPVTNPPYFPAWSGSSLCNNTYNPVNRTFYIRIGNVAATGWVVIEEHLVRQ